MADTNAYERPSSDNGFEAGFGDYVALLKPRVMSLVVFTAFVGLWIAPVPVNPYVAFCCVLFIALGGGASGALNMWYDADIDAVMKRTAGRPVPAGRVTAGEGNDHVVTGTGADNISAGSGNDRIRAGAGNDTLIGGEGDDLMLAEAGNDRLWGQEGNDTLNGSAGNDTMTGGVGADVFFFNSGRDVITDFDGDDDRIDVRNTVDWSSRDVLLKAEFPCAVANAKAAYDLGLGFIERGNNTETVSFF